MAQGTKRSGVRVGDEERHKAAEILADHHAHGRLSQEEFEDRLGAALTAQTTGELGRLLADLPLRHESELAEREQAPARQTAARELTGKLHQLDRRIAPTALAAGGVLALAWATSSVVPDGDSVFLYALATGAFGLVAGRAVAWFARRRHADDERHTDDS